MEEASTDMELKKRMLNDRLMLAERGFLDADGLLGNRWFKHLVSVLFFKKLLFKDFVENYHEGKGYHHVATHYHAIGFDVIVASY